MADIHYFQRYSKKENVVTNNTLLLLSRLYHYSPAVCENVLNALLDDENLSIGPSFRQQEGGTSKDGPGSIPDGTISQPSFRVVIETKIKGDPSTGGQLVRHLNRFQNADQKILLLIDKSNPSDKVENEVEAALSESGQSKKENVMFGSTTFMDLVEIAREEVPQARCRNAGHNRRFRSVLHERRTQSLGPHEMRTVLCGTTLEENIRHGVYYHPADRGYSELGYLGLYKEKSVRAVGKLEKTAQARVGKEGNFELVDSDEALTEEEKQRIEAVATEGMENHEYSLNEKDHRYFLVDQFARTDDKGDGEGFNKTSKYGLPGEKHFDLKDELGLEKNEPLPEETTEIAHLLAGESWS
jgi:hypothetical protein